VPHDDIERLNAVVGHSHVLSLQRILQRIQADFGLKANGHFEQAILALARQRHFDVTLLGANVRQILLCVQVLLAVEHGPLVDEQLGLGLD